MNKKTLDEIIEKMTDIVEKSKEEIFFISEQTMLEYNSVQEELEKTKILVNQIIRRSDELETKVRLSRQRLSIVSREFKRYSEREIRQVYEETHSLQTELMLVRQEEKSLRQKRDDLERRLIQLNKTIEHANNLGRKVSVISSFLQDDFSEVNELLKTAHEKQQFGLKVIEAQELERKRISREIHDGPAQSLANILIRSEIVDLLYREGKTEEALKEIKDIRESIRQSLQEVRRIIFDLRPMDLDDLGLVPTIKRHISSISSFSDLEIDLILRGEEKRLHPNYEVAVFRIIQEGVQNAIKHAKASYIRVFFEMSKAKISLSIYDNGIGFNVDEVKKEGYGIIGMKERVELLDGILHIDSEIGKGTTVKITIPYESSKFPN